MKCSICGWNEESFKSENQVCAECRELMEEENHRINKMCLNVGMTENEIRELEDETQKELETDFAELSEEYQEELVTA